MSLPRAQEIVTVLDSEHLASREDIAESTVQTGASGFSPLSQIARCLPVGALNSDLEAGLTANLAVEQGSAHQRALATAVGVFYFRIGW